MSGAGAWAGWLLAGILLVGAALVASADSLPVLTSVVNQGEGRVALSGSGFGQDCAGCEVVGDFGGFRYAFPVERWSPGRIVVRAEDLGRGRQAEFEVRIARKPSWTET